MRYFITALDVRPLLVPLMGAEMVGFLFAGSFVSAVDGDLTALLSALMLGLVLSAVSAAGLVMFSLLYAMWSRRFGCAVIELSQDQPLPDGDERGSECHTDSASRTDRSRCRQMP